MREALDQRQFVSSQIPATASPGGPLADVFVSYARDDLPHARQLAAALEARGLSVWWDRRLLAGDTYGPVIKDELDTARCVVVLWSATSVESRWVRDEAEVGLQRSALVPVVIDDSTPPLGFRQLHTESLSGWLRGQDDASIDRVLAAVERRIEPREPDSEESMRIRLQGALAGRYRIEREAGRGGMAVVFRARDIKHNRDVAIKVLSPELAANIGSERFHREIQTAARLNHPHILPLFDSGEADGLLYYVMPFVEGESAADRLRREGQLPLDEALRIGHDVAEALAYAHGLNIVHRDIKPSNIMLAGPHALVTDFGIAKALSDAGMDSLTGTGAIIGTVQYMAPEQAAGERVDGRADIYSLGCTLFELLAGHVPFSGSAQAVIARHTMEPAPSLQIVRSTVGEEVDAVILKALAKSPADRFRDASELAKALTDAQAGITLNLTRPRASRPAGRSGSRAKLVGMAAVLSLGALFTYALWPASEPRGDELDPRRVAVTYFSDASEDGRHTALADGLTEDLIRRLGPVRGLDVATPGAVAQFRDGGASRDSIARALEAGTIVEGSVEDAGLNLGLTVRLVDGASGAEFARRGMTLPADDVLAIRDSVTLEVEQFLRRWLGEEVVLRQGRDETSNPAAWSAYAVGEQRRKGAEEQILAEHVDSALTLFAQADAAFAEAAGIDVSWARPLIARVDAAGRMAWFSSEDHEAFDEHSLRGLRTADEALERDPGNPHALSERGWLKYLRLLGAELSHEEEEALLESAEEDLVAAINGDNTIARAHLMRGLIQTNRSEFTAAYLSFRQAWDADPYLREATDILNFLIISSLDAELFAEGREDCATAHRRYPADYRFIECGLTFMIAPGQPVDVDTAWELRAQLEEHAPPTFEEYRRRNWTMMVAGVLAKAGLPDSARAVSERARGDDEIDPDHELLLAEAYVNVLVRDHDEAFRLLTEYMARVPSHRFAEGEKVHWRWSPLEADPRFETLVMPGSAH